MRILHTAATYVPSLDGVAEVVRNISERLVKRGHEVHVATGAFVGKDPYEEWRGVHVHRFPARGNLALGMYGKIEKYREFVRSSNWDIVVNHGLHVWPTDALLQQVCRHNWPSVLVTHGLVNEHPAFHKYYSEIQQQILHYARWVRVSSCSAEASYAEACQLPTPPVIANGVDAKEWAQPTLGLRNSWGVGGKPWVVNVSNHSPLKNHDVFFKLADALRSEDAHFTLVAGTYPMAKWGLGRFGICGGCACECKLRSLLRPGLVDLRMNRPRREVVSAIQEAGVMVSTSGKEANSLVLLESMAAGVPWVSFDVGSARENEGGIVVGSFGEMAGTVTELLHNPKLRKRLGAAGRARVAAKHDWDEIVDEYERLYICAVGDGGKGRKAVCRGLNPGLLPSACVAAEAATHEPI